MADDFAEMELDPRVLKAVQRRLGFERPTLVQQRLIPLALSGRDVLARSRTGTGKTAAYAIPLVQRVLAAKEEASAAGAGAAAASSPLRAIVLVPTRELADQTAAVLESVAFYCYKLVRIRNISSSASAPSASAAASATATAPCDVVVGTPGRVAEALRNEDEFGAGANATAALCMVVLDEADLLLSYGHDAALREVAARLPATCQGLLLSATLSSEVDALKRLVLHSPVTVHVEDDEGEGGEGGSGSGSGGIGEFCVRVGGDSDRFLIAYALLRLQVIPGKTLVFLNAIDRCFRLKLFLDKFSVRAAVLNSTLPLNSRLHTIEEFNRGIFDFLLATDDGDFSRGLDYKRVTAVLNFDVPPSAEAYVHRVGRTGRAGSSGTAIALVAPEDADEWHAITEGAGHEIKPYALKRTLVDGLRYRCEDVLRSITRKQVKEAQEDELRAEVLNSERLKEHFSANPREAGLLKGELRHDRKLLRKAAPAHLRAIPGYLFPPTLGLGSGVDTEGEPIPMPRPSKRRMRHQRTKLGSYGVLPNDPVDIARDMEMDDRRTGKRRKLDLDPTPEEILPPSMTGGAKKKKPSRGRGKHH